MALAFELDDPSRPDRWAVVHLSTKSPGRWQLTEFDGDQPQADRIRDSPEQALTEALRERMTVKRVLANTVAERDQGMEIVRAVQAAEAKRQQAAAELDAELDAELGLTRRHERGGVQLRLVGHVAAGALLGAGAVALREYIRGR